MAGVVVFNTLKEALNAGFTVYEATSQGYTVRRKGPHGFEMALVILKG